MSALTESIESCQKPLTSPSEARWLIFPSLPTTRPSRSSSFAMRSFISTTALKVSATFPAIPVHSSGRRTLQSPLRRAVRASSNATLSMVFGS